jgi:hypothetical protein
MKIIAYTDATIKYNGDLNRIYLWGIDEEGYIYYAIKNKSNDYQSEWVSIASEEAYFDMPQIDIKEMKHIVDNLYCAIIFK